MARKKTPAAPKAPKKKPQKYGIAEWYGYRFIDLSNERRRELIDVRSSGMPCPYFNDVPALAPAKGNLRCNKDSGVCSIRNFEPPAGAEEEFSFGTITATCPNRFLEGGIIVSHIGGLVLGTDKPLFAKELAFLRRSHTTVSQSAAVTSEEPDEVDANDESVAIAGQENVGRIDLVFVDPDNRANWCAVEMQAVYFSGKGMSKDYPAIRAASGNDIAMPGESRRPDFRSSGPKRLMPQLMVKVPTLRRWGKKMVVVIDKPFYEAMDTMENVKDISNCDIVWVVVKYDEAIEVGKAKLTIHETAFTTLEDAVKGLTAGQPTTLSEFEERLSKKLKEALPEKAAQASLDPPQKT